MTSTSSLEPRIRTAAMSMTMTDLHIDGRSQKCTLGI
jgi:hypothetical protein